MSDVWHLTPIPFSRHCRANHCVLCVHMRCGCFCHPEGYGPNHDEMEGHPHVDKTPCPIDGCDAAFMDPEMLASHVASAHPWYDLLANGDHPLDDDGPLADVHEIVGSESVIQCPSCSRTFTRRAWFEKHLLREHDMKPDEVPEPTIVPIGDAMASHPASAEEVVDEEVDGMEERRLRPYALLVEVGAGVYVELVAASPLAFSMAAAAFERWGVPFTDTQPE